MVFYSKNDGVMFSGDVLFQGSVAPERQYLIDQISNANLMPNLKPNFLPHVRNCERKAYLNCTHNIFLTEEDRL
ncbi:MBL fold metallo-hydrolase, partial [Bacteroides sp. 519]|uniref:MBL fold metallo-hydrolase n=1 Tax=Bacteroides sp. 519 TaxID=2302937 RepID=UPI00351A25AF